MKKYRCQYCEAVFTEEEADSERDFIGYYGSQECYQYIMICPECGSDSLDDYEEEEEEEEEEEDE